jgi:hypothetical protein
MIEMVSLDLAIQMTSSWYAPSLTFIHLKGMFSDATHTKSAKYVICIQATHRDPLNLELGNFQACSRLSELNLIALPETSSHKSISVPSALFEFGYTNIFAYFMMPGS